jgi:predicted Zn finger-like uncharacterized protein
MILICPACGTQYVVKDGAIPSQGRQVRCASCKHSWHQDPEPLDLGASEEEIETVAEAALIDPSSGPEAEERAYEAAALAESDPDSGQLIEETPEYAAAEEADDPGEMLSEPLAEDSAPLPETVEGSPSEEPWTREPENSGFSDDSFSPFAHRELHEPGRRKPLVTILIAVLLIAALAAAFWFLAPPEWKQRVGIASVAGTPLQLMMTHSDRQRLASGNELLAVTGRVINPTEESQPVPPIQAQLRTRSGQLVYSWTIAPPAKSLPPGASATFNSAEVNVPAGGDELTITLGPKA